MDTEEKTGLFAWLGEHPKSVFWTRFLLWFIFACGLPFAFIIWRFKLYETISSIQLGGWGIVAIIIAAVFALTVIKYVKIALNARYSMLGQCLGGACKILLPLLVFLAILYSIRDNINVMIQVLTIIIISEAIGIPLNPLPKWAYEMQKDVRVEERKETIDYMVDRFLTRQDVEKTKVAKND